MFPVLKQRNFALLWIGQLISVIGDWVLLVALPFYVYDITGSAVSTGVTFMSMVAPSLLFGSLAGVFVDRWDRRKTMILADVLRACVLLPLLFVSSRKEVWLVYMVGFSESTISQFFAPAKNAILPLLAGEERLVEANSLNAMSDNAARLIGPSLGGVLLGFVGFASIALLDSASFLISAFMIFLISSPSHRPEESQKIDGSGTGIWRSVWNEWVSGLRIVKGDRLIKTLFTVGGLGMLADSILTVLIVVFVKEVLGVGAVEFGWLMTARGLGGLSGGFLVARLSGVLKPTTLISLGTLILGLLLLIMINFPSFHVALILITLAGIPAMAWMIGDQTLLQSSVEDCFRGRIFGTYTTTVALMTLVGMGFGSIAGENLGIVFTLNVSALIYLITGAVAFIFLRGIR